MSLVDCDHWSIVVIPPRYTNWFVICVQVVLYQWYLYTPGVTSGYVFSPTCSDLSSPQLLDRPGWGRMLVPNECAKLLLRRIPGAKWWDGNTYVTYVYYTFQPNLVAEFWTVSVFGMGNILYPRGVGFKHLSFSHHFCGEIILFDYCNIFWSGLKPPTSVWFRMKHQGVYKLDSQMLYLNSTVVYYCVGIWNSCM